MSDSSSLAQMRPEVVVRVELLPTLLSSAGQETHHTFREAVQRGIGDVLTALGLPGHTVLNLDVTNDEALPCGHFMRIHVNGQLCRYSDDLLRGAHSYVTGCLLDQEATPAKLLTWLLNLGPDNRKQWVEFLTIACVEIIKQRPDTLLGLQHAEVYAASLREFTEPFEPLPDRWPPDPATLLPILKQVLNVKISLGSRSTIAQVLQRALAAGRAPDDIVENVIAEARQDSIELQLAPDLLRQLTKDWQETGPDKFPFLRGSLFVELGLTYPPFRFVQREDLKPNSFAFKINDLTTPPFIGLQSDQCLTNATAKRLKEDKALKSLNLQGLPAANPATGQPASVVNLSFKPVMEIAGVTAWDQIDYFILCLATILRTNGACFVNCPLAHDYLEQLEGVFPDLVKTVRTSVSDEQITRILRGLASEEISVRNLRLILELTLDYDSTLDRSGWLAFIRTGLQRQISAKYIRDTSTLVVYLLDPQLEKMVYKRLVANTSNPSSTESHQEDDDIAGAIWTELDYLRRNAPTAMIPQILTRDEARQTLREIIAPVFPRMGVLSYAEVPSYTNIQPVARIALQA